MSSNEEEKLLLRALPPTLPPTVPRRTLPPKAAMVMATPFCRVTRCVASMRWSPIGRAATTAGSKASSAIGLAAWICDARRRAANLRRGSCTSTPASASLRHFGLCVGRHVCASITDGRSCGLCPTLQISAPHPRLMIALACWSPRSTQDSALVCEARRPSGRPTAMSTPRVTRCVNSWQKLSSALVPCTSRLAMEYERANSFETKASRSRFT
mmetsp:Transcript_16008/g.52399  ORF Transcript_16008/g.52399 Transcript_16008/m.52399 type:complete len:213 (+) Transcript_16008:2688-3326(+)